MECDIIRDLLPLFAEDMTSEKSNRAIMEHTAACPACMQYLQTLTSNTLPATDFTQSIKPLKKIQQKLLLIAVFLVALVSLLWGLVLLQPGDEMAYSLLVFYLLIPLTGCIVCGILTKKTKIVRWVAPFLFGGFNTVLPMLVFGTTEIVMTVIAFGACVFGMLIQFLILFLKSKCKK